MRNISILVILFFLTGCDIIDDIKKKIDIAQAKRNFSKMCKKEDNSNLLICNSKAKTIYQSDYVFSIYKSGSNSYVDEYNLQNIYGLYLYSFDNFYFIKEYKYKKDNDDTYKYMYKDNNGLRQGDCEDYVITFIEDNIENGNIKKGEVYWFFGKQNNGLHSWLIIKRNGKEYLFDTYNKNGIEKEEVYSIDHYKEYTIIYSY